MLIFACGDVWQQAAEMLRVKPTWIKNKCLNLNIKRWPYWKVRCIKNVLPFSCHLIIAEDDILLASRCITNRMYTYIILIDSLTSISQLSFSGLFQQSVFVGYMYNQDLAYRRTIETVQKICHRRHVIAPPLHVLQIQSVKVLLSNGEGNLTAEMILELELNIAAILKNPNMDQVTSPRITIERLRAFRFKHRAVAIVS